MDKDSLNSIKYGLTVFQRFVDNIDNISSSNELKKLEILIEKLKQYDEIQSKIEMLTEMQKTNSI